MIWDIIQPTGFNSHFESPNLQLQQLLKDQNIITEMKNLNPDLLKYIHSNQDSIFTKLIVYSTIQVSQQEGRDRGYLYPYVSSEILAIESDLIYQVFFGNSSKHWNQLINFLKGQSVKNAVLMGYFAKIMNNLSRGRKIQVKLIINSALQKNLDPRRNLNSILDQLHQESIGEILKDQIMQLGSPDGLFYEQRKNCLQKILKKLNSQNLEEQYKRMLQKSICQIIFSPIISKFQTFSSGEELLHSLLTFPQFEKIYSIHNSNSIIELLITLLKKCRQTISTIQDFKKEYVLVLPEQHRQKMKKFAQAHLNFIKNQESETIYINQTHQKVIATKSKYLLFTCFILQIVESHIQLSSSECSFLVCWLFSQLQQHPFNDILQNKIIKIMQKLLINEKDKNSQLLILIISKLIQSTRLKLEMCKPHLYNLNIEIKKIINLNSILQQACSSQGLSLEEWKNLDEQYFGKIQKNQNIKWGTTVKGIHLSKLIVDQEDKVSSQENNQQQNITMEIQTAQPIVSQPIKVKPQVKQLSLQKDPFSDFQFWNQPISQKTQQKNKFNDFENFTFD